MTLSIVVRTAVLLAFLAPRLAAQRLNAGALQARGVPPPDTTLTLRAGERDLVAEFRVPAGNGPHPLAIVIHGGCFHTKFADSRYMRPMAEALRLNGIVAIDGPGDLVVANPGFSSICGSNVLEQLLASTPLSEPDRWRMASPSSFLPLGVPQALVRGGLDWRMVSLGSAPGSMPAYGERAHAAGDSTWVVMSDSTNHFAMLDPQDPAFAVLLQAFRDAIAAITRKR